MTLFAKNDFIFTSMLLSSLSIPTILKIPKIVLENKSCYTMFNANLRRCAWLWLISKILKKVTNIMI